MSVHKLWVEKYRPTAVSEYIFHDEQHRQFIEQMVDDKSIPHLLLSGVPGSGKTTIAKILISAMGIDSSDVLYVNASNKRGIDTFREEITTFATTVGTSDFKIVHLEEADRLTPEAQDALRAFTEENCDFVRFILTCNHRNMITPAIKSRMQELHFKAPSPVDVTIRLVEILKSEKVKATLDVVDQYITQFYPDVRKIINAMQQRVQDGKLLPVASTTAGEYRLKLIDLIAAGNWNEARTSVVEHLTSDQWEDLYRFLYTNIHKAPKFKQNSDQWNQAILLIADHLYRHTLVADPEINAAALFINLSMIK